MGIFDTIYRFFADEKIPLSRKIKFAILGILVAFLINDHYDFIHTIVYSYKVDYLMKLESAKHEYKQDAMFMDEVNRLIEAEHNRKGVVEKFFSLLSPKADEIEKYNTETAYNKILRERDPIVHTITGAFIPLTIFVFSLLGMMIRIFVPESRDFDSFFWTVILAIFSAIFTYLFALAWTQLDPIGGYVWINYSIQLFVNIALIVLFVACVRRYDHKTDKEENDVEEYEPPC